MAPCLWNVFGNRLISCADFILAKKIFISGRACYLGIFKTLDMLKDQPLRDCLLMSKNNLVSQKKTEVDRRSESHRFE